ncbi:MAG: sigma 54-interacting transcriptional regulator, partial [Alistipes senegalensis]|nr:sigma 54-interacting transcriptional regulator [Bacteroides cellulosilyticus]MCM1352485.1 sigma 54-interacting transcriptional regulator [Alistipes senegalensis]
GTLFMDEIGDMSLAAQAKVLRALQENRICRVGSDKDIDVDVRVIAATNKNLKEEIGKGNFREDLYHRIGVVVVRVPALRDRAEDIPLLVEHFIRAISAEYGMPEKPVDADAMAALCAMRWSGNIRELRNAIERLLILSADSITLDDVQNYC